MTEPIFVFGASGHGKVVIEAARRAGYGIAAVLDDAVRRHGESLLGAPPVCGAYFLEGVSVLPRNGVVAIGNNAARLAVALRLSRAGHGFVVVVDPFTSVSSSATLGVGSLVMPGAIVNADAIVGEHVIINTSASVDHDCVIGDGVHVAPGARLCGGVSIGSETLVGAGAVVVPGVRVGSRCVIGAGSTVLSDLGDGQRATGVWRQA